MPSPRGKPFAQDNAHLGGKKGTLNAQFSIKKALPFGTPLFISAPKASPGYVLVDAPHHKKCKARLTFCWGCDTV